MIKKYYADEKGKYTINPHKRKKILEAALNYVADKQVEKVKKNKKKECKPTTNPKKEFIPKKCEDTIRYSSAELLEFSETISFENRRL